ncbi:DUF2924 domain-containing protein [Altererythrobacter salegens]|uniref:DUF2924 domain-containing protein n=1 Tax=Croceibacterium salegens TaxID=1737568 RepID=A0A6I4SSF2_9SPHN|nr:DUF2924 domain-containing protein [Croceibacterium salegens]MXO58479.1 DUF2924 domain-containing protein [Croceibacterium salegens]
MPGLDIEDLAAMSPAELRTRWRELFRKPAPDIGPGLLQRGIAWRLQSRLHGGLPSSTRKAIEKANRRLEQTGSVRSAHDIAIKPGTRLVREWNGKTYHGHCQTNCTWSILDEIDQLRKPKFWPNASDPRSEAGDKVRLTAALSCGQ